jgi:hypothetical protein
LYAYKEWRSIAKIEIASNLWNPPRSLNENIINVGLSAKNNNTKKLVEYCFIILKNKKMFNVVNMIKNIENIFFAEIKKKNSINNIIVPNNPLFTKP